ncbi:MAG TPA: N-acetyltransferase [Solirubrobacteraceae bacterium]|nr:N-acetyltransferase [Solirubrobacteraceae bacterium]
MIREERDGDRAAVRAVEIAAFGRDVEADIVDALRGDPACALSLVAELDGEIVGHVLLHRGSRGVTTLGPLAVLPSHQRRGIGTALMHGALARIPGPVVLLGHPDYYRRFGFRPAFPLGITNQWGIEGPEWMIRGAAEPGEVRYPEAFASPG